MSTSPKTPKWASRKQNYERVCLRLLLIWWQYLDLFFCALQDHTSGCEYLKIPCVHPECGMMVKKALLSEHLKNECLYRLVECELCHAQILLNRMTVR